MIRVLLPAFLVCTTGIKITTAQGNNIITHRFKYFLREFCPDISVCQDTALEVSNRTYGSRENPCCTECSCAQDCEKTDSCCFPTVKKTDTNSICLFPTTKLPKENERMMFNTYQMISGISRSASSQSLGSVTEICGAQKVAPWGSLYPVFSKQNRRIYKNMACAKADNVSDGVVWDAYLYCKNAPIDLENDNLDFLVGLDSGHDCRVDFVYPGNLDDVKSEICYEQMIDTCPEPVLNVTTAIPDVVKSCESGLVSPFRYNKLYANVFCYACNGGILKKEIGCTGDLDLRYRDTRLRSFSALFDTKAVISDDAGVLKKEDNIFESACRIKNGISDEGNCRPVYCPRGKYRTKTGTCKSPVREVYNQGYNIYVKLTADQFIDFGKDVDLTDKNEQNLSPLESWTGNWELKRVMYEIVNSSSQRIHLVLLLSTNNQRTDPEVILRNIKYFVKKPWLLKFNLTTIVLQSDLKDTHIFLTDGHGKNSTSFQYEDKRIQLNFPAYATLYLSDTSYPNTIDLTNTYFCEQVDLTPSEYVLSNDKSVLLNTLTYDYVFDTEFTISKNTDGAHRARVCLHKSGFRKIKNGSPKTGIPMTIVTLCIFQYLIMGIPQN